MARARIHYARRTRTRRHYGRSTGRRSPSVGTIVLISLAVVLLIYLVSH
jgi:hypothetical protein